ncbi:ESF1 homolog isoform X2 [Lineus longissimus]|uniref:ESF1 homolog isoform X2 n=1 Tax=Lineus longissimus TaxID=88925 RepID=UPI00315D0792
MDQVKKDARFAHIGKDPRFHNLPSRERKVKIDKRFKSMFEDKKFKLKYSVDKRGRPINTSTNENLRKFYELSDSNSEDSEESEEEEIARIVKGKKKSLDGDKRKLKDKEKGKVLGKKKVDSPLSKKSKKNVDGENSGKKTDKNKGGNDDKSLAKSHKGVDSQFSKVSVGQSPKSKKVQNKKMQELEPRDSEDEEDVSDEESASEDDEASSSASGDDGESESDASELDVSVPSGSAPGGPDLARGEGLVSSSDDESETELADADKFDHNWGELDQGAAMVEDATSRLAVCNMDWDRIKAQDIMILVNSFKPQRGVVKSVSIYPSEFGVERMKEEEIHGPKELVEDKLASDEEDPLEGSDEKTSGLHYHREKLRQYQLNRLKYYYAVIECDSRETANAIYTECDGIEYESSCARLDLRFIPEDMTFEHEPKSVVKDVADISTYKPSLFFNTALNQSKVSLTWDETDQDRLKVTMRKPKSGEIDMMDVQAYLASSSGEEEEDEIADNVNDGDRLNRYRALLQGIESKEKNKGEKDMEMEITWEPGLRDTTADLIKKKAEEKDATPWEQYLMKKKEKKKKKREEKAVKTTNKVEPGKSDEGDDAEGYSDDELPAGIDLDDPYFKEEIEGVQLSKKEGKRKKKKQREEETEEGKQKAAELQLLMMDEDDNQQHFNLKDIMKKEKLEKKKKRKKKKPKEGMQVEDTFEIDVTDPRFDAMYKSHHYNVDPSSHEFKKTKAMESIIQEKLKRKKMGSEKGRVQDSGAVTVSKKIKLDSTPDTQTEDKSLLSLVKSVKMKTQKFQQKKDSKKS